MNVRESEMRNHKILSRTYRSKRHAISPIATNPIVPCVLPMYSHSHRNGKENHGNEVAESSCHPHNGFRPPSRIVVLEPHPGIFGDEVLSHNQRTDNDVVGGQKTTGGRSWQTLGIWDSMEAKAKLDTDWV